MFYIASLKSKRIIYALLVLVVIALGILSRKVTVIPLIVGDILYAVMMFLLIKFLLIQLRYWKVALISLSVCYFIEISQLYHASWIVQIRNTTIGALVLGHGFLWSDMIAYTVGTAIVYFITLCSSRFLSN
ncbi:ribosomal maturation YjgA family protein [Pedobacter hiemivivus]|uniref:DUF2809 domain-containing protein n=1 Tax=Pedobacter hiemivivus TaxID=2530454 RepID=A0A4R0NAN3_9SPHI|nr:DUF2809 domain-containing protein [Pedobacter hiemivivus]TCC97185.1 DUF2809 domain-containing protein [Pedobacter hiemivivus]